MGTNFYRIPSEKEISNFILGMSGIEKYNYFNNEHFKIHIGKSSMGWVFTFDHNDWKYYRDKEDLIKFLESGQIFDEYERLITFEDFNYNFAREGKIDEDFICKDGIYFNKYTNFS